MQDTNLIDKTVIVTGTLYDLNKESDKLRYNLSLQTIESAIKFGYKIIVIDTASSKEIRESYKSLGAEVFEFDLLNMRESRAKAIELGQKDGKEFIVWMEPEKYDLIKEISKVLQYFVENNADIVIPQRESLESYPYFQQKREELGNLYFERLTGLKLDTWFGLRVMKSSCANYFTDYNGEYGDNWEILFIPLLKALKEGVKILGCDVNYTYPAEQRAYEENNSDFDMKRLVQLYDITKSLHKYWL